MKIFIVRSAFAIASVVMLTGCFSPTYVPQTHNVPMFTEKQQLKISATASVRSLEFQGAYSFTDHLGAMANFQLHNRSIRPEIGVGGFTVFDNNVIGEVYAGFGASRIDYKRSRNQLSPDVTDFDQREYLVDVRSSKFFIQPSVGFDWEDDEARLAFTLKVTYWHFSKYLVASGEPVVNPQGGGFMFQPDRVYSIKAPYSQFVFEPSFTFTRDWTHTSFLFQFGLALYDSHGEYVSPYYDTYGFTRIGIVYRLNFNKESTGYKKKEATDGDRNYINSGLGR